MIIIWFDLKEAHMNNNIFKDLLKVSREGDAYTFAGRLYL